MDVEIIDFFKPQENNKILFIGNIPLENDDFNPSEFLYEKFCVYGLLHDVRVIDSHPTDPDAKKSLYAFVTFYSRQAASRAQKDLSGRLYINGHHLRVLFSNKPRSRDRQVLFHTKCFELASHYLGFNGWSMECQQNPLEVVEGPGDQTNTAVIRSSVTLHITQGSLVSTGHGVTKHTWNTADPSSKSVAVCKGYKQSHHMAVQEAFSKVLLVVLENNKVHAEINLHVIDAPSDEMESDTLQVTDLTSDPEDSCSELLSDGEDTAHSVCGETNVDVLNAHILAELQQNVTMQSASSQ